MPGDLCPPPPGLGGPLARSAHVPCCAQHCVAVSWESRCVLLAVLTGVDLLLVTSEDLTAKYILLLIFCLLPHEWMGITQVSLDASVIL